MGKEILVAITVLNFLVIMLHVVILVLLIKFNFGCFSANQRDIFIVLSFTELSYSVFDSISLHLLFWIIIPLQRYLGHFLLFPSH